MNEIILASASPRRKELMTLAGVDFNVMTEPTDETIEENLMPEQTVVFLARKKASAVALKESHKTVVGADTIVEIDGRILGKPADYDEAFRMLSQLSGRSHNVYTGVCITCGDKEETFCEKTEVTFYELSDKEIDDYIKTGDCFDKAGAYGIQSRGCTLVKKINGDYFNVVGLPIAEVVRRLASFR